MEILKVQLHTTYQSLNHIHLIKIFFNYTSTIKPNGSFGEKMMGILSNFESNKMVVGASKNL